MKYFKLSVRMCDVLPSPVEKNESFTLQHNVRRRVRIKTISVGRLVIVQDSETACSDAYSATNAAKGAVAAVNALASNA